MSLIADSLKNALKDKSGKSEVVPEINLLSRRTSRKPTKTEWRKIFFLIVIPLAVLLYLIHAGAFDKRRTTLAQLPIWRSLGLLKKSVPPAPPSAPVEPKMVPQPVVPAPPAPKEEETLPEKPAVAEKESVVVTEPVEEKKPVAPAPATPATPKAVPKKSVAEKVEALVDLDEDYIPTPPASKAKARRAKETKDTSFRKTVKEPAQKSQPAKPLPSPAQAKQAPLPEVFKNSEYHFNQALFFEQAGDFERALGSYRKAAELGMTENPDVYNNMGVLYKDLGKYDEAMEALTKAVYLDPNYAKAYNNIGVVYYQKRNYSGAIANYEKAIALKPNNVEAYNNLAVAYKKMRQLEKAKNVLNKALSINTDHPGTNYNLALLHEEEGATKAALHFYRRFVEFGETSHPALVSEVKEHMKSLQ